MSEQTTDGGKPTSLVEHARAVVQNVTAARGDVCKAVYAEAHKDPVMKAALDQFAREVIMDTAKVRTPGFSAFNLTLPISQRAADKMANGDIIGSIADYAAVLTVGLGTVVPFVGGDMAMEGLRATGVDLPKSPIRNAYNALTGMDALCTQLDARARVEMTGIAKASEKDLTILANNHLSEGQIEILTGMAKRVEANYRQHAPEISPARVPDARTVSGNDTARAH